MFLDTVELHGIEETVDAGDGAIWIHRAPASLREQLNDGANSRLQHPSCAELRCVAPEGATVTLSADAPTRAIAFRGPFQCHPPVEIGVEPTTFELPDRGNLDKADPGRFSGEPFSPEVFRLIFHTYQRIRFHGIDGVGVRPPEAGEVPRPRLLCYGTSITDGAHATGPHLTYPARLARLLGADLINLGVGGSAHCEAAFADWIAARDDWDAAVLALSVNMMGAGFTVEEFRERVEYMVRAVAEADPARVVAAVTIYPHVRDFSSEPPFGNAKAPPGAFRQALRDAVSKIDLPNLHLFEGADILDHPAGLCVDLVHPGDDGFIRMGENLARRISPLIADIRR